MAEKEVTKTGWSDLDNNYSLSTETKNLIASVRNEAKWIAGGFDAEHINNWNDLAEKLAGSLRTVRHFQFLKNDTVAGSAWAWQYWLQQEVYELAYALQTMPIRNAGEAVKVIKDKLDKIKKGNKKAWR